MKNILIDLYKFQVVAVNFIDLCILYSVSLCLSEEKFMKHGMFLKNEG